MTSLSLRQPWYIFYDTLQLIRVQVRGLQFGGVDPPQKFLRCGNVTREMPCVRAVAAVVGTKVGIVTGGFFPPAALYPFFVFGPYASLHPSSSSWLCHLCMVCVVQQQPAAFIHGF
jgi:hypothetical protein